MSYMDNTRILTWVKDIMEQGVHTVYVTHRLKKRLMKKKGQMISRSVKPYKKHYVQCGESLSGRCVTELLSFNKIRRATTQNNTDNKGSDGGDGPDGGWGQREV